MIAVHYITGQETGSEEIVVYDVEPRTALKVNLSRNSPWKVEKGKQFKMSGGFPNVQRIICVNFDICWPSGLLADIWTACIASLPLFAFITKGIPALIEGHLLSACKYYLQRIIAAHN